ncbi:hypothetical protein [Amycolatopsis sp. NPDC004079]|uniref:hypothetical protein n=1 Tax=Amycolatopsis sp. NPDC004079 TaxID=3154549 RepID=UPI0033B88BA0
MGISSEVLVQDPVDAEQLFVQACAAVGLPSDAHRHLRSWGAVRMLQAAPDQGAEALVTVHYAADGGPYPDEDEDDDEPKSPDGHAFVRFSTSGDINRETPRDHHRTLVDRLGRWLTEQELRWSWRWEGDPWVAGFFRRPERTPPSS